MNSKTVENTQHPVQEREQAMTVLVEVIRQHSEAAELICKDELRAAFEEQWQTLPPQSEIVQQTENSADVETQLKAETSHVETSDAKVGAAKDGNQASPNVTSGSVPQATFTRRQLLRTLVQGQTHPEVAGTVPEALEEALEEATEEVTEEVTEKAQGQGAMVALLRGVPLREVPDFEPLLAETLAADADLISIPGPDGETYYYASSLLSNTYAGILAGKSEPCTLLAETVRSNSKEYPRPIPLDIFEYPPFDYSPETVQACLKTLAEQPDCKDIRFVECSTGTVYLYSEKYMDKDYALFLADRADIGLIMNP